MAVWIGTSGWQYKDWRGRFYPAGLAVAGWLEHYAARFATVEVNNAFYRLPEGETFARWAARTPDDFRVAVKASRYLTHVRRLRDPEEPVRRLMDRAGHLGAKLGPVLLQLPPTLRVDVPLLDDALACFPARVRVAVEVRDASWASGVVEECLARRGAALCLADAPGQRWPIWRTASWGYLRMHQGMSSPRPCYGRKPLERWAQALADRWGAGEEVYAYFNNDPGGCAVRDARRFAAAVERVGLVPTRVPGSRETPVGISGPRSMP